MELNAPTKGRELAFIIPHLAQVRQGEVATSSCHHFPIEAVSILGLEE